MLRLSLLSLCLLPAFPGGCAFQQPLHVAPVPSLGPKTTVTKTIRLQMSLADVDSFWQTNPYTAAALICGFKASAADIVAQVQEFNKQDGIDDKEDMAQVSKEQQPHALASAAAAATTTTIATLPLLPQSAETPALEEGTSSFSFWSSSVDYKRNAAFLAYGALYQGITQEFFFNHLYPVWFGTDTSLETVLTKVSFTLLILTTLLTLPSLYASKALMEGFSLQQAAEQYWDDIQHQALLQKFYTLWGPVLCLTFSVIPEHLRVTFVAAISFFWLIILSNISSGNNNTTINKGRLDVDVDVDVVARVEQH